ncbi:MAG TPA: hypothetical protein VET48_10695 [Steroidobacteraceae bacterium]|nr:hypothetical protein [Steroidobacteraceae bacterium]
MIASPHFCFTRAVHRSLLAGILALAYSNVFAAADFSGYWTLDLKRSETEIDAAALSPTARERLQNFDPLKNDPVSVCMPYAMPRVMTAAGAFPMEIVQTENQVTMIFDAHDEVRRVFLNKTADPNRELAPLWLGYAYGKWEGATLVVDTLGITDQSLIDATGVPHSDKLHVIERLRRLDANTLLDEMTLHDEAAFTRPITRKIYYTRTNELQQREFRCTEQQWLDHVMGRAKELTRELKGKQK